MDISIRSLQLTSLKTPLLAIPVRSNPLKDPVITTLDESLDGALARLIREESFKGKFGQTLLVTTAGKIGATRLMLFGLSSSSQELSARVRTYAQRVGRRAREKGFSNFYLAIPKTDQGDETVLIRWLSEGALLGTYRFDPYLTGDRKPKKEPKRCTLLWPRLADSSATKILAKHRRAIEEGQRVAESVCFARDLVNTPGNDLRPADLAQKAQSMANEVDLSIKVLQEKKLESMKMGLLLAVARGSEAPPRLVHLTHEPRQSQSRGKIVLVGKGVTFDSGGLSLKTGKGMIDMKCDMGGAALVLGVMRAAALLDVEYTVHGIIPMVENMPSGSAYRPGDVFKGRNGKTVEIFNTDAEGRLILADALAYGAELEPDMMIDFATLTGACMVALGPYRAALFGTSSKWSDELSQAATRAGELLWTMPLASELRDGLKSQIADLRNVGGAWGGAITAALFLKEFVGKTPWLHLDIAGPAYLDKPHAFSPKGGTGYGVLSMIELLRN